jgi:hypothetical protein
VHQYFGSGLNKNSIGQKSQIWNSNPDPDTNTCRIKRTPKRKKESSFSRGLQASPEA